MQLRSERLFGRGLRDMARGRVTLDAVAASENVAEFFLMARAFLSGGEG